MEIEMEKANEIPASCTRLHWDETTHSAKLCKRPAKEQINGRWVCGRHAGGEKRHDLANKRREERKLAMHNAGADTLRRLGELLHGEYLPYVTIHGHSVTIFIDDLEMLVQRVQGTEAQKREA